MAHVSGWDIQYKEASENSVLKTDVLEAGKMGKCLSNFDMVDFFDG